MPVITTPHEYTLHAATFSAFVAPSAGSSQLCAWRVTVGPDTTGMPHRVSHEEVLLVTGGSFHVDIDDGAHDVSTGDVVLVPAGGWFTLSSGPQGGSAWVTTSVGLTATTAAGDVITPPWAS